MNVLTPTRGVVTRCIFCQTRPIQIRIGRVQRRTAVTGRGRGQDDSAQSKAKNPVLDQFLKENPDIAKGGSATRRPQATLGKGGDISPSSIFEDDRRAQILAGYADSSNAAADAHVAQLGGPDRDPENMDHILDPHPAARERWERKKVIQLIQRGGRLTKDEIIKRTEREHLSKSHNLKTSVKKLGMLARQIAGKRLDDAIVQMRFSKKKVAQEVLKQLELARDEAIVMRGMGLGGVDTADEASNLNNAALTAVRSGSAPLLSSSPSAGVVKSNPQSAQIQLKDGKRHTVTDPTTIYIDQAWVGRGPYGQLPDYRARGRLFIMRTPWTSISILLKEEKTRVREHIEREEKRRKEVVGKNMWTHLPDRPVQWQRQWYTF